jgi:putative zinc finger/helix-turn-helix YgiT family protein
MKTKRENVRYDASGLSSVTLQNVEVARCPKCGATSVTIPAIEELHRMMARALTRKRARLAPPEIRFLRKYLGWSGADFARHMGSTPETVSRWEHGTTPMGPASDRLLRMFVATKAPTDHYVVDVLAELAVDSPGKAPKPSKAAKPVHIDLSRDARAGWRYHEDPALVAG